MIGSTFGPYRIVRKLGEGGMGTVWVAEDPRLQRHVALKLLPRNGAGTDDVAVQRFIAEARLASAINHPHIVAIYDVGEADDTRYIAMELVDGGSLRDLINQGPLRVRDAVEYAIQVADALSAAHRAGILHRDIKPDNIFIASARFAKLGDFGVAKLRERPGDPEATVTGVTTTGVMIGSPLYFSPEQAHAEELDARSDVFSFAATLYEMVTGVRAFEGRSAADVVTKILREDPAPPSRRRPDVPRELERIILKGLEKQREYRYQDMADVLADLRRLKRDVESGRIAEQEVAEPLRRHRPRLALAVAAVAVAAALAVGWFAGRGLQTLRTVEPPALLRVTADPGLEDEPAWSPDGRSVMYVSDAAGPLDLFVRQVPGERALAISPSTTDEGMPAYSPDGTQIAFVSSRNRGPRFGIFLGARAIESYVSGQNGDLFVMPAFGGTARKLADHAYDPSWSPDGTRIVFRSIADKSWRLYTVSVEDGRTAPVAGVEPRALAPAWSPDGKWIAYVASASAATGWDLYVVPAAGGTAVGLTQDRATIALHPAWMPDTRAIVYSSSRGGPLNLWRVPFRAAPPGPAGPPERLTTGIGEDVNPTVSRDGSIAFATVHTAPDIKRYDMASGAVTTLTSETTSEDFPRLSPDGRRLLFYSNKTGREEVWLLDLKSGEQTRVSRDGGSQSAWAPDGRTIAYSTPRGLYLVSIAGGELRRIGKDLPVSYPAFSPDGRSVAFAAQTDRGSRLLRADVRTGEVVVIPTAEGELGNPAWTPDARTIYYQLDQLGLRNIWATDLATGRVRQVTSGDADDAHPDVSNDGRTLLFLRGHRQLMVLPLEGGNPRLLLDLRDPPNPLVEFPAWTPDGSGVVFSVTSKRGDLFVLKSR